MGQIASIAITIAIAPPLLPLLFWMQAQGLVLPDMDGMDRKQQMRIPQGLDLFVARPVSSLQRSATTTAVYGHSPSFPQLHLQTQQHASMRPSFFSATDVRYPSALLPPLPTALPDAQDGEGREDWEQDSFHTELEETASSHPSMEHLATEMDRRRSSTNLSDLITRALTLHSALDKGRRPASAQWWRPDEEAGSVHHPVQGPNTPPFPCSSAFEELPAGCRRGNDLPWRFRRGRSGGGEKCIQSRRVCGVHRWMCVVATVVCIILVCITILVPLSLIHSTQGAGSPKSE